MIISNAFEYFFYLIEILFTSAGDDYSIKGALLLLFLFGFICGSLFFGLFTAVIRFIQKRSGV